MHDKLTRVAKGSLKTSDGRLGWMVAADYQPGNGTSYLVAMTKHPSHLAALGLNDFDALDYAVLSVLGMGTALVSRESEPHDIIRALRCSQADAVALLELTRFWFAECPGLDDETFTVSTDSGLIKSSGLSIDVARETAAGLALLDESATITSDATGREVVDA